MCDTGVGGTVSHSGRHSSLQMFMGVIRLSLRLRRRQRGRLGLRMSLPGSGHHAKAWGLGLSQLYWLVELNSGWRRWCRNRLGLKYGKVLFMFAWRNLTKQGNVLTPSLPWFQKLKTFKWSSCEIVTISLHRYYTTSFDSRGLLPKRWLLHNLNSNPSDSQGFR